MTISSIDFVAHSLEETHKRLKYIKDNPNARWTILVKTTEGAAEGLGWAVLAGVAEGAWQLIALRAATPLTICARLIGKCVLQRSIQGAVLGAFIRSTHHIVVEIPQSIDFLEWKVKVTANGEYQKFIDFLMQDETLRGLTCPITHTLISCPIKDPRSPHVFEKEALLKTLKDTPLHPITRLPLQKENLTTDFDYHFQVLSQLRIIGAPFVIKPLFREGIESFIRTITQLRAGILAQAINESNARLQRHEIDSDTFITEVNDLKHQLRVV